ncbi:MAG: DUF2846 domain-containing protein [gamma proteobacterium endosymbiont of Lamellibrachia anaximandri]|nr:DUF2846 domain-containing protein [gamma proteobacterium endosymbiont of Lamellibrachia anaximandri]MBL3619246.1 DUF2846 domain-containing protein [gamma proteobacterium endosymbiont of Lamellibrachia anaximandri]
MKSKKASTLLIVLIIVMSAWATPVYTAEIPQAQPDKGLIVFYRLDKFGGKAIRFNINHPGGAIGQLLSGTLLYKYFDPGAQTFYSQVISQDAIIVNVEAGKIYYVRGDVKMGLLAGRPNFT